MNPEQTALLIALKRIQAEGPQNPDAGICQNFEAMISAWKTDIETTVDPEQFSPNFDPTDLVCDIAYEWPKSKSWGFPIEGNWRKYHDAGKWEGERGKIRQELISFMIDHLENQAAE